jgi:hypothetical protein
MGAVVIAATRTKTIETAIVNVLFVFLNGKREWQYISIIIAALLVRTVLNSNQPTSTSHF